jgi:hypothetical protein
MLDIGDDVWFRKRLFDPRPVRPEGEMQWGDHVTD